MYQKTVFPRAIQFLIITNIVVFILDILTDGRTFTEYASLNLKDVQNFQIWRLASYLFIHSRDGFTHILFNMLMLWMFGSPIVLFLGQKSFLKFYFMAGIFSGIVTCIFDWSRGIEFTYIGASGAVLACVVFFGCYNPNQKLWIWGIFPLKAKWMVSLIVLGDIFFFGNNNVASISHLAGAFFGIGYYFIFFKRSFLKWKKKLKQYHIRNKENQDSVLKQSDAILKKISEYGLSSLTAKEKLILKQASEIRSQNETQQIERRKNFYGE